MSLIYADYLYKDVIVRDIDDITYKGHISDFGDAFDGEEEYDRAEEYLVVNSGGSYMLLFESEIKEIVVLPEEDEDEDEDEEEVQGAEFGGEK